VVRDVVDGRAELLVPDDLFEGSAAIVVLLDGETVADHRATSVGGN
jgi:hypothetical protein